MFKDPENSVHLDERDLKRIRSANIRRAVDETYPYERLGEFCAVVAEVRLIDPRSAISIEADILLNRIFGDESLENIAARISATDA